MYSHCAAVDHPLADSPVMSSHHVLPFLFLTLLFLHFHTWTDGASSSSSSSAAAELLKRELIIRNPITECKLIKIPHVPSPGSAQAKITTVYALHRLLAIRTSIAIGESAGF